MKRDIRELFKNDDTETRHDLPENHRGEFLQKLKPKETKGLNNFSQLLKTAAILVIALTVGFSLLNKTNTTEKPLTLAAQIEAAEKEYLAEIKTEWQNFTDIATDVVLVKRYEKKMADLDADYQEISAAFKADANNILVVENLIENLQTRLRLLKDIQEHIKILNQKPRTL